MFISPIGGIIMINEIFANKQIKYAKLDEYHGDVLIFTFTDNTILVIWCFDNPNKLQKVLYKVNNQNQMEIIEDKRTEDCKIYTNACLEKYFIKNNKPLFRTYHNNYGV